MKSEFGALTWLETNFPDYKQVVAGELEKLKLEIKQDSNQIVQATQTPDAVMPAQPLQSQIAPEANNVFQGDFQQQPSMQPQPITPPAQPMNPDPYTSQDQQPPMAA